MDKEEILKRSREENQNKDIFKLEVFAKAQRIAGLIAVSMAFILMFVERVILDAELNYGYSLIIFAAGAGLWYYRFAKFKNKSDVIFAVVWTVMTVLSAVEYVLGLIR